MNNLQFEILNALNNSNGMPYIDVINLFPPQYTETRLMLQDLKKKGFVSFTSHEETNSFVKITPSGLCWLLECIDKLSEDIKCSDKSEISNTKTNKFHSVLNFLNMCRKFVINAAAFVTAIGFFVKLFEAIF